jgi:hypothetical protein
LKQRRIRRALQALKHILKVAQRFAADNAAVELHKFSARQDLQVLALQAKPLLFTQ